MDEAAMPEENPARNESPRPQEDGGPQWAGQLMPQKLLETALPSSSPSSAAKANLEPIQRLKFKLT